MTVLDTKLDAYYALSKKILIITPEYIMLNNWIFVWHNKDLIRGKYSTIWIFMGGLGTVDTNPNGLILINFLSYTTKYTNEGSAAKIQHKKDILSHPERVIFF